MQLIIISGKGGTGKTTVAASLSYLSRDSIKADCDVDAPNLHILLKGEDLVRKPFSGAKIAHIDSSRCVKCGRCIEVCRFNAITDFTVDCLKCEGCAACTVVCGNGAIKINDDENAQTIVTETDMGILSRAEMDIGAEGSGKLVTEVRKNASQYYKEGDLVILDGSPGIGCAVMASVTGCDAALIVVEPTRSGLEDFLRVLSVCKFFGVKVYVCINKYDINADMTGDIEGFCKDEGIEVMGKIPFDERVKQAVNEMKPVVVYEDSEAGAEIRKIWNKLKLKIKEEF